MQDLMILTDVMCHLRTLNMTLQGKKIVSDLTQTNFSFQNKIRVFQTEMMLRNFSHFPLLKMRVNSLPDVDIKTKNGKIPSYKEAEIPFF